MSNKRERFKKYLRETFVNQKMVEEYIKEAEHMDGAAFWEEFEKTSDVACDYLLYSDWQIKNTSGHIIAH